MRIGKLEISLYGPFVTMLDCDPIEIYAPRCVGHYASIFTTEDEAPLDHDLNQGMNKIFRFSKHGIRANASTITPVNAATHLSPPKGYRLCADARRAWFCLQLPKPTHVVGIKPDCISIKGTDAPSVPGEHKWATALRLVFDYDMDLPDIELSVGETPVLTTTLKDYSAAGQNSSTRFDIIVRHVGPFLFDPDHDDARACFEATTKLFQAGNVDLDWEVHYANPALDGRTGSDCGSPQLVFG